MVEIREQKAVVFDWEEPLSKVASELARIGTCVVVTRNGKYDGIIDSQCITRMPTDPSKAKAGTFSVPAPEVSRGATLLDICRLFFSSPFKALPVVEKQKPVAVIGRAEVLEALATERLLPKGSVGAIMTAPAEVISESESIAQAKSKLHGKKVKRLVVVDDEGKFTGVIGSFELSALSTPRERPPLAREKLGLAEQPVRSLEREPVGTVSAETPVAEAALLMSSKNISNLVVLNAQSKPAGIVSAKDILGQVVVYAEQPQVEMSGLDAEDKESMGALKGYLDKFIEKHGKSYTVQRIRIGVKKQRKQGERKLYKITGQVETAKEKVNASVEGWELKEQFHELLNDFAKLLERARKNPMHRTAGFKKEVSSE